MLAFVCSLSVWLSQWILRREEFIIHNVFWEAEGRMEAWRMVAVLSSLSVKPNLLSEAPAPLSGGSDIYMFISLHLKKNENPRKAWACFVKYIYCWCHIYLHMLNIQMTAPPKWFIPAGALRTPLRYNGSTEVDICGGDNKDEDSSPGLRSFVVQQHVSSSQ